MAGSLNKVLLIGRVGKDPETRRLGRGNDAPEIAEFSLATSDTWRDRNSGERKEKTEWHNVKIMSEELVKKVVRPYVKKGTLLYLEGKVETESWEDRDSGQKKYATKIVVPMYGGVLNIISGGIERDGDRQDDRGSSGGSRSSGGGRPGNGGGGFSRDLDDDIPFAPEWR